MRRGKVLNLSRFRLNEFLLKNGLFTVLCILFIAGIILGSVIWDNTSNLTNFSRDNFTDFLNSRSQNQFFRIFIDSFLSSLTVAAIIFISGSSMFGVVLVPSILIYEGFTYGSLSAFVYSQYALKGIAFNAVLLLPFSCILTLTLIALSVESVKFSFSLGKLTLPSTVPQNLFFSFKIYFLKFIVFSVFILLSAVIDALLSSAFISKFNF